MSVRKIKDEESIYEELTDVDYATYERNLNELVDVGYMTKEYDDDTDRTYYRAKEGMYWSEVVKLDSDIKKQILLSLIDNPKTFFVLYNTQKGKLRIGTEEICTWAYSGYKVVAFLVVDNDKTLADQTAEGMFDILGENAQQFTLSSNSKTTIESIRTYMDAYAADKDGEYKMPVIIALSNSHQLKKILTLMDIIKHKVETRNSPLRYGCVFDEADKVYPQIRNKEISIGHGRTTSLHNVLVTDDYAVYRLGFISATEGDLMEKDYPECANAFMYPVPPGDPNYRAAHTEDAVIKHVPHYSKENNDMYAEKILEENKDHFTKKIVLKNGTEGFRKIIVNGGGKNESMESFATRRVEAGAYAITLNQFGVVVYLPRFDRSGNLDGYHKRRYSPKGIRLGQLLFNIYNELGLHDKVLFIIGRRKVDRGIGFHFAPSDGSDGLIWTDEILGRVPDKYTACQKAGRLAGKVAQCPQYPGELVWWTDKQTGNGILKHNNTVDETNKYRGCSMLQAFERAKTRMLEVHEEPTGVANSAITIETFDTSDEARTWCANNLQYGMSAFQILTNDDGTKYFRLRNEDRLVELEKVTRESTDIRGGIGTSARCMPVIKDDGEIGYIVIYLKTKRIRQS